MLKKLNILQVDLFPAYEEALKANTEAGLEKLKEIQLPFKFDFYEASASTYSSNIEGNTTSLDSFLRYVSSKALKTTKEFTEIEDLVSAYQFAKKTPLNKKNFLQCNKILSKEFLIKVFQGKLRKGNVVIGGKEGIVYVAIDVIELKKEVDKLFADISFLLNQKLTLKEVFYYASLIHLVFEKIHPFNDGNGRAGRLLEKWFLSNFIEEKAWMIESEKYYFEHRQSYYKNLSIGFDYYSCDYNKSLPFLLMLPNSLTC